MAVSSTRPTISFNHSPRVPKDGKRDAPAYRCGDSSQSLFARLAFAVTPQLLVSAILWAATIGLLGGLFPAIRAVRIPIAAALREM